MRFLPFTLSALLLLPLSSCVMARQIENEPLDPTKIQSLVPGKTTAKQVVELFGAPTEVVQLHKRSAYRYEHTMRKYQALILLLINFGQSDSRSDRLWVFFDESDVLSAVGDTLASHRTQYGMPWEDVHEKSDGESRDAERFGKAPK